MTDEAAAVVEPAAAEPAAAEPIALVNHEGVFSENWRETLPEDIRDKKIFGRTKDFAGMARSLAHFESMSQADTMVKPSETSGDDAWNEYYRIGGRPDTPQEYGFTRPKDLPEEYYSEEEAVAAAEMLYAAGASKALATKAFAWHNDRIVKRLADKAEADEITKTNLENELRNEWANSYEAKAHLGNVAVEHAVGGDEEYKARLLDKVNRDPDLIKAFSALGEKFQESTGVTVPVTTGETLEGLTEQIQEIMNSDAYNQKTHPNHKATMTRLENLYKKKNQSQKIA